MIRLRKDSARGLRASPLCHWPESFIAADLLGGDLHRGREQDAPLFRVLHHKRSSVPESFRGGGAFGGQHAGSLPLAVVGNYARLRRNCEAWTGLAPLAADPSHKAPPCGGKSTRRTLP